MTRTAQYDHTALAKALDAQLYVISRSQALACGLTAGALRYRTRPDGPWRILLPGVYLVDAREPNAALTLAATDEVRAIVADAVQRNRCTVPELTAELSRCPVRGSARFRQALAEVADGVRSIAEGDLRALLRRGRVPAPYFNAKLYAGETFLAMPDAWWPDAGVAVEVDSREWHLSPADWERTLRRHAEMSAHGIIVLHFTPGQIKREPERVLAAITKALASAAGRPALDIRTVPAS